MKQYAIYLRKSRSDDPKAPIEEVLARHEKILLETARKMKLNVVKIFREVASGESISNRPEMKQLLKEVNSEMYAGVLVMEIERLARGSSIDQGIIAQSFQLSNTKIITPYKIIDPNDEFDSESLEFGLFMSRREYKVINRRLQRGRLASVKEGKYVGNKPPYGYLRKKLEGQKGYTLEPHPEQADIVRLIFEWYVHGEQQPDGSFERLGTSLIATKLNDLKVPTYKGGPWVNSTILEILRNPVYIGKIRWNSRPAIKKVVDGEIMKERPRANPKDIILVDGLHEPLIDIETWQKAQEYLSVHPPKPCPRKVKLKNPLAGLVVCGYCGRKMVRRPYPDMAPHLICNLTGCPNVSSALPIVEERLLDALAEWLNDYKIKIGAKGESSEGSKQIDITKKAIRRLEEEINTLEKQQESLYDLLEQGVYTTEIFLERSKVLAERLQTAQTDLASLQNELQKEKAREIGKKDIIPNVEQVLEFYKGTKDPAARNNLLKQVLEKVIYKKEKGGRWHRQPDEIELILFPKLPK